MESYKNLVVWQKSMELVKEVYLLVKFLPKEEMYALSDQMRRSAVSIPSNIAEGKERYSNKEFVRFLYLSRGSRSELETQINICEMLGYLTEEQTQKAKELLTEVGKMLNRLVDSIEKKSKEN